MEDIVKIRGVTRLDQYNDIIENGPKIQVFHWYGFLMPATIPILTILILSIEKSKIYLVILCKWTKTK